VQLVATGETTGWFDPARDGGFVRRAQASYLADAGDAYVAPFLVRQHGLRKSDLVIGTTGRDPRGRTALIEITSINGGPAEAALRRPEFNTLTATYPERKLYLETGRPAKGGPELIRRAIDLIAPIGYGRRERGRRRCFTPSPKGSRSTTPRHLCSSCSSTSAPRKSARRSRGEWAR
jgi:transcription termination factor Rho